MPRGTYQSISMIKKTQSVLDFFCFNLRYKRSITCLIYSVPFLVLLMVVLFKGALNKLWKGQGCIIFSILEMQ